MCLRVCVFSAARCCIHTLHLDPPSPELVLSMFIQSANSSSSVQTHAHTRKPASERAHTSSAVMSSTASSMATGSEEAGEEGRRRGGRCVGKENGQIFSWWWWWLGGMKLVKIAPGVSGCPSAGGGRVRRGFRRRTFRLPFGCKFQAACSDGSRPVGGKCCQPSTARLRGLDVKIKAKPKLLSCTSLAVLSRSGHVIRLSPPPSHPPPASFNLFRPFHRFSARAAAAGMNLVQSCFEKPSLISTRGAGRTFCCPHLLFEAAG